jgi:hypothetical protein
MYLTSIKEQEKVRSFFLMEEICPDFVARAWEWRLPDLGRYRWAKSLKEWLGCWALGSCAFNVNVRGLECS